MKKVYSEPNIEIINISIEHILEESLFFGDKLDANEAQGGWIW